MSMMVEGLGEIIKMLLGGLLFQEKVVSLHHEKGVIMWL